MKIVTGEPLVNDLRSFCDNVNSRLWISSPFIGDLNAVLRILGNTWVDNPGISIRLITDIEETSGLNYKTTRLFFEQGKIKHIRGLHAKIYIIDENAILTSANLTGTAFSKRFEVGNVFLKEESGPLIDLFEKWWKTIAEDVTMDQITKISVVGKGRGSDIDNRLPFRGKLPPSPKGKYHFVTPGFQDYEDFLKIYKEFADLYSKTQRLWPGSPLFFETDALLNYLFHHATGTPSKRYIDIKPRSINKRTRQKDMEKYALSFKRWIDSGSDGVETTRWRNKNSLIIRKTLDKKKILNIGRKDVKIVVDRLNCMNSLPLNKAKFLNPNNNDIKEIRKAWNYLLYADKPLQTRMTFCDNTLSSFGRSSVQELLGFFKPNKYPLRNRNSSAGLRLFGYNVSVY